MGLNNSNIYVNKSNFLFFMLSFNAYVNSEHPTIYMIVIENVYDIFNILQNAMKNGKAKPLISVLSLYVPK